MEHTEKTRLSDIADRMARVGAKPNAPILDAGEVEDHLKRAGIVIGENGVTTHSDGTVSIDAPDNGALRKAWSALVPVKTQPRDA